MLVLRSKQISRGILRGFFASVVLWGAACDKPTEKQPQPSANEDVGGTADAGAGDVAASTDTAVVAAEPAPKADFAPPWDKLAPPWKELDKSLTGAVAGKMSGEAWGKDVSVRQVIRAACGGGTLLQAVFETDKGLRVTPAMPVRFFSLATERPVTYREGNFEVTVNFSHDTPERVAGKLLIKYEEHGQEKTFIDLEVDAKPLQMLLEPRLDGKSNVPEFHSCHPSGRFYAKAADGRTASGFTYAGVAPNGRSMVIMPHFTEQSGMRIIVHTAEARKEPWSADLSKDAEGAPVRVAVEAVHTPELTSVAEARGSNIGSEQKVSVRRGTYDLVWKEKGKTPSVELTMKNLAIPELIEGPLRGTTLTELRIEATGYPPNVYPDPPDGELLGPSEP